MSKLPDEPLFDFHITASGVVTSTNGEPVPDQENEK